jgi:hypothetical protein
MPYASKCRGAVGDCCTALLLAAGCGCAVEGARKLRKKTGYLWAIARHKVGSVVHKVQNRSRLFSAPLAFLYLHDVAYRVLTLPRFGKPPRPCLWKIAPMLPLLPLIYLRCSRYLLVLTLGLISAFAFAACSGAFLCLHSPARCRHNTAQASMLQVSAPASAAASVRISRATPDHNMIHGVPLSETARACAGRRGRRTLVRLRKGRRRSSSDCVGKTK